MLGGAAMPLQVPHPGGPQKMLGRAAMLLQVQIQHPAAMNAKNTAHPLSAFHGMVQSPVRSTWQVGFHYKSESCHFWGILIFH
jgi:hypothetical protein